MTSRILSVTFDKATLPLSPNCDFFDAETQNGKIVFGALTSVGDLNDYTRHFNDTETASFTNAAEGAFTLKAMLLEGDHRFTVAFSVFSEEDRIWAAKLFDAKKYLEDFLDAAEASGMNGDQLTMAKFEKKFSAAYLQNALGDLIEGNEAFWTRLSDDLDTVTAPVNYAIMQALEGKTPQPVFVDIGHDIVPAFRP